MAKTWYSDSCASAGTELGRLLGGLGIERLIAGEETVVESRLMVNSALSACSATQSARRIRNAGAHGRVPQALKKRGQNFARRDAFLRVDEDQEIDVGMRKQFPASISTYGH
jgi:hypothetical protein